MLHALYLGCEKRVDGLALCLRRNAFQSMQGTRSWQGAVVGFCAMPGGYTGGRESVVRTTLKSPLLEWAWRAFPGGKAMARQTLKVCE